MVDMRERERDIHTHTEKVSKDRFNMKKVYIGWILF
jgi:hypothetical protein